MTNIDQIVKHALVKELGKPLTEEEYARLNTKVDKLDIEQFSLYLLTKFLEKGTDEND